MVRKLLSETRLDFKRANPKCAVKKPCPKTRNTTSVYFFGGLLAGPLCFFGGDFIFSLHAAARCDINHNNKRSAGPSKIGRKLVFFSKGNGGVEKNLKPFLMPTLHLPWGLR